MPLAVPAYWGAMSIGTDQIGAMINSKDKNASDKHTAVTVRLWINTTGIKNTNAPRNPATITPRRAIARLFVLRNSRSLTKPPVVSPITPAKNIPAENNAELCRF